MNRKIYETYSLSLKKWKKPKFLKLPQDGAVLDFFSGARRDTSNHTRALILGGRRQGLG